MNLSDLTNLQWLEPWEPASSGLEAELIRFALALALITAVPKPAVNVGSSDRAQGFGQRSV